MKNEIVDILKIVIPLLAVIIGAYLAHHFSVKKKRTEEISEKDKKVRLVLSVLLDLWHEFNYINRLSLLNTPRVNLLFKLPNALLYHTEFDIRKFNEQKSQYDHYVSDLKSIDAVLFYKLDKQLDHINHLVVSTLYPLLCAPKLKVIKKDVANAVSSEIVKDLEETIHFIRKRLLRKEKREIKKILNRGRSQNFPDLDEVPSFVRELFKPLFGDSFVLTADRVNEILDNETFVWLLEKLRIFETFSQAESEMTLLFNLMSPEAEKEFEELESFPTTILTFIAKLKLLSISDEEQRKYFEDDKSFYVLINSLMVEIGDSTKPFQELILALDSGMMTPRELLETIQETIPAIPQDLYSKQ